MCTNCLNESIGKDLYIHVVYILGFCPIIEHGGEELQGRVQKMHVLQECVMHQYIGVYSFLSVYFPPCTMHGRVVS